MPTCGLPPRRCPSPRDGEASVTPARAMDGRPPWVNLAILGGACVLSVIATVFLLRFLMSGSF